MADEQESAPRSTPTSSRQQLAERLRALRQSAGLSVEEVARSLLVSPSKISRLETATRPASQRDVRDLCRLYGVADGDADAMMEMAEAARKDSWYLRANVQSAYQKFIGLELTADEEFTYQTVIIPGLFQTADYARALLRNVRPPGEMSDERIDDIVTSRARRQEMLVSADRPLQLFAVVDQVALERPIGGRAVMKAQLEHLLETTRLDNVSLRLIPKAVGSHPGVDGSFIILHFRDQPLSDALYVESLFGELITDKAPDVERAKHVFAYITDHAAVDPPKSRKLLEQTLRDFSHH